MEELSLKCADFGTRTNVVPEGKHLGMGQQRIAGDVGNGHGQHTKRAHNRAPLQQDQVQIYA
jgi:hypothetical protein